MAVPLELRVTIDWNTPALRDTLRSIIREELDRAARGVAREVLEHVEPELERKIIDGIHALVEPRALKPLLSS